jgi:hypothetical protein
MKVCVIGGLDRMEKDYIQAYKQIGCKAKVFNKLTNNFEQSLKCTQCVVLLTSLASHNMVNKAKNICKRHSIPFICTDKTSPCALCDVTQEFMNCVGCEFADKCGKSN